MDFLYLTSMIYVGVKSRIEGVKNFALFLLFLTSAVAYSQPIFERLLENHTIAWYLFLAIANIISLKVLGRLIFNGKTIIAVIVYIQCLIYSIAVLESLVFKSYLLYDLIENGIFIYTLNILEITIAGIANGTNRLSNYTERMETYLCSHSYYLQRNYGS